MLTDPTPVPNLLGGSTITSTTPVVINFGTTSWGAGTSTRVAPQLSLPGSGLAIHPKMTISHSVSNENAPAGSTAKVPTDRTLIRLDYDGADPILGQPRKAFCYLVVGRPRSNDIADADVTFMVMQLIGLILAKHQTDGSYKLDSETLLRLVAGEA